MRSLRFALCSLVLASAVGLTACGSDDDGIGATTAPSTAAASTPESSQAPSTTAATSSTLAATSTTVPATSTTVPATPTTTESATSMASTSTPSDGELTLEGVTWTLSDETDLGVDLAGVDVNARFEGGTVSGLSGCNRYTGTSTGSGGELTISTNVAATMMACPEPQSTVEAAYLAALPTVASYAIDGNTLTLSDTSGTAILVYTHLAGDELLAGEWTVTGVRSADAVSSPIAGSELTATFADGGVSGNAGCNTFNGTVTFVGDELTIGPLATTRTACTDEAIGQQETDFLAALENTASFSATSAMVTLLADDGTVTAVLAKQ